MAKTPKHEGAY